MYKKCLGLFHPLDFAMQIEFLLALQTSVSDDAIYICFRYKLCKCDPDILLRFSCKV